ncbi:MAG: hypothetical protein NVSMB66_4700 [Candidatus Doudnabacteria bacterium]
MKKIVYVVLLLLLLGGAGFFIYSKNKTNNTPVREYGILNPNPNAGSTALLDNSIKQTRKNTENVSLNTPTKPIPVKPVSKGRVLGSVDRDEDEKAENKARREKIVKKSLTHTVTASANGLTTYKIPELNFSVMVPSSLQPRMETAAGNILAFYKSSGSKVGEIEVIPDAQQSYSSLVNEISANKNVTNIQQITINGQPAIIFNDQRYAGSKVIAFAYKNNVYYMRGQNAFRPYSDYLKFLN